MKGMDIHCREVDANNLNKVIDFSKAKNDGISFIIPRDGWGMSKTDPKLIEYVKGAKAAGIAVPGVYHFVYATNLQQAIQNAQRAVHNVEVAELPKTTVIWCDIEYDTVDSAKAQGVDLTPKMLRDFAESFCNYVLAQGYLAGIYCNKDYLVNIYGKDIANEYDIWLADLEGDPDYPCVYQQYDWHGLPSGCKSEVDLDKYIGSYSAGTAKPKVKSKEVKKVGQYQIMTDEQWVERLITLARGKSSYKAKFPYNLLYWDGERFWSDCSNLEKALFNGRDINDKTVGSYAWPLPATGDATEYALLIQCSDIQWGHFDRLKLGDPRLLYQEGHIGAYLGKEWNEPGQGIVNCVESTPAWEDGIQFSYVAPDGARSWCKGATVRSYWQAHALASKWVIYTDNDTQEVVKDDISSIDSEVKGTHYNTTDLAVMIIRNKYGNGAARKNNLLSEGYSEDEIRAAQDKVNTVVKTANSQKAEAEKAYVVITAAYDVIAGAYGDGEDRKKRLIDKYGEEIYGLIQAKVDELLG